MKILHLSDLHFCPKHLKWVSAAADHAIAHITEHPVDCWVISGDSYDSTMGIHEDAFAAFLDFVCRLRDLAPGIVLYGTASHDHPGSLEAVRHTKGKYAVYLADEPGLVALMKTDDHVYWQGTQPEDCKYWPRGKHELNVECVFSCLPSLNKADPDVMAVGAQQWVRNLMEEWRPHNEAARAALVPTVLITHGTVTGCKTESNYAMVSPDHEFSAETLFSCGTTATMLGHIHKHQSWSNETQTIAYAGSLTRLVHGHHDDVGFLIWDVGSTAASFDFVACPAPRLVEIVFDGPPDLEQLKNAVADVDNDTNLRVRWDIDQEHAHEVDKDAMSAICAAAGNVKLEGTINPIVSVRAAGIGAAGTIEDKLTLWAQTTGDEDRVPDLSRRLEMLRTGKTPEAIAAELT